MSTPGSPAACTTKDRSRQQGLFKVLFGKSFFKMALEGYVGLEGCYVSPRSIRPPAESKALATAPRGTPMPSIQRPICKQTSLLNQEEVVEDIALHLEREFGHAPKS